MSLIRPLLTVLLIAPLFACGQPSGSPPPQQPPAGSDPPPTRATISSRDLVLADLKAGRIDHATSLLYRLYAQHGDTRLPEAYRGDGADPEDLGLFLEADRTLPTLPEADRARLRPWLARPNDPISPYSAAAAVSSAQRVRPTAAPPCVDGWATRRSLTTDFRGWARCDGREEADLDALLGMLETVWAPLTALMGPPVPDEPDGGPNIDDAIDVYAVDRSADLTGGRRVETLGAAALAFAQRTTPVVGKTSSGFMVVQRASLGNRAEMRSNLVHEFFHVLEYAHNQEYFAETCAPGNCPVHWFVEASAKWAESHFAESGAVRPLKTFPWFRDFVTGAWGKPRATLVPLNAAEPDRHRYAAYAWPLYMELAKGAGSVASAWDGIAGASTWEQADDAISAQLPFADEFPSFALANYNRQEVASAVPRRYQNLLPDLPTFEAGLWYGAQTSRHVMFADTDLSIDLDLPNLAAEYLEIGFNDDVQEVRVDLADLAPLGSVRVDALLKPRGGGAWQLRSWAGSRSARLCDGQIDVERAVLVVTNRAVRPAGAVKAKLRLSAPSAPCAGWSGSVAYTVSGTKTTEETTPSNDGYYRRVEEITGGGNGSVEQSSTSAGPVVYLPFSNYSGSATDREVTDDSGLIQPQPNCVYRVVTHDERVATGSTVDAGGDGLSLTLGAEGSYVVEVDIPAVRLAGKFTRTTTRTLHAGADYCRQPNGTETDENPVSDAWGPFSVRAEGRLDPAAPNAIRGSVTVDGGDGRFEAPMTVSWDINR